MANDQVISTVETIDGFELWPPDQGLFTFAFKGRFGKPASVS